ncbi:Wzz/FepE/Etk N-terminal domain-containing protein [Roseicitreum antarcticum]|uniref:Uncharacterized protein involved in exopolysaccharide biosynthesis n=1 Tax=Roseicitreum antarcticum TaxID=564137 RepID=A0A1H2RYB9_9RHOB|nr:Wzz/FepE/Etk N-terminal domain-containing protein [Roseicitreum antarcticum]SDW24287.1 Uncharacterized protein involved in exopolysaccharide biosynthesis [Roseicitreum antarcticum]
MGPIQSLGELTSLLRRRAKMIAVVVFLGTLAALVVAMLGKPVFESIAVIQVQTPLVRDQTPGVADDVNASVARRLQQIEQRLMVSDYLIGIGERYELFPAGAGMSSIEKVLLMREMLWIESVAAVSFSERSDGAVAAIQVYARTNDRHSAAEMANEVSRDLIEQTERTQMTRAQEALSFFRAEEARLNAEALVLADQIAAFQIRNSEFLPANVDARRGERARLEEQVQNAERDILALRAEKATLEAEQMRRTSVRRIADIDDEVGTLQDGNAGARARLLELSALFNAAPGVQQEMAGMERDLAQIQDELRAIALRRADAEIGSRLEADNQAERFNLLEAAQPPDYQVSRSKRTTVMMGVIGSLVLALMIAYGQEIAHPVVRSAARMERALALRPVLTLPHVQSRAQRRHEMRIWAMGLGGAALTLAVAVIGLQLV